MYYKTRKEGERAITSRIQAPLNNHSYSEQHRHEVRAGPSCGVELPSCMLGVAIGMPLCKDGSQQRPRFVRFVLSGTHRAVHGPGASSRATSSQRPCYYAGSSPLPPVRRLSGLLPPTLPPDSHPSSALLTPCYLGDPALGCAALPCKRCPAVKQAPALWASGSMSACCLPGSC